MAIRKFSILSLLALGTVLVFTTATAVAQTPSVPAPAPLVGGPMGGMMLDSGGIQLAPGETIVDGPPELQAYGSSLGQAGAFGMSGPLQMAGPGNPAPCATDECYFPCDPGYYFIGEVLYMNHIDNTFSRSNNFGLSDFNWEFGTRATFGRKFDCVDGYEFAFTGLLEWNQTAVVGPGATSQFVPNLTLPGAFDAFNATNNALLAAQLNAPAGSTTDGFQSRSADFNSIEFNRTMTGWDVIRVLYGVRGILYNEDYLYSSNAQVNTAVPPAPPVFIAQSGALTNSVENLLIGPQLGLEMYYPLSRRVFVNSKLKGGIYLDIAESRTQLFNNGTLVLNNQEQDLDLAAMFEASSQIGFHLTSELSVFAGYDIWFLCGIATNEGQLPRNFSATTGNSISMNDNLFIHGITAGLRYEY